MTNYNLKTDVLVIKDWHQAQSHPLSVWFLSTWPRCPCTSDALFYEM